MEQVTDAILNEHAESLGEIRDQIADLESDEASHLQGALDRMRKTDRTQYTHAGIRFTRVTGTEKLLCKRVKDKATAPAQGDLGEAEEGE